MSVTYPIYPNTVFPDAIQTFAKYLDITQSDAVIYNSAIEAMIAGNLTQAQALLNSIPNVNQKALTAEKLNRITDTVQALQQYYAQDIDVKVAGYQTTWEDIINKFQYKGVWAAGAYNRNNMVSYASNEPATDKALYLYIATKDISSSVGNPYTDYESAISAGTTPNWYRITIRGRQGASGASQSAVSFKFIWDSLTNYTVNDIVVYENKWWIAITSNINVTPSESTAQWALMLDGDLVSQYPVQANQPMNNEQMIGDLWFQLI